MKLRKGNTIFRSPASSGRRAFTLLCLTVVVLLAFVGCSSPESADSGSTTTAGASSAATSPEPTTVYRTTVREPPTTLTPPEPPTTRQTEQAVAARESSAGRLRVTFLEVGQGSSILIRLPNGGNVLIDGGPREQGGEVVADLGILGVGTLDAVMVSHADEDHSGGLIDVIDSVPVSTVYDSGYPHTTQTYAALLDAIERRCPLC